MRPSLWNAVPVYELWMNFLLLLAVFELGCDDMIGKFGCGEYRMETSIFYVY